MDRDPPKGTDVGAHHTSLMEAGQKVRKIRAIRIGHLSHHLIAETPSTVLGWPCSANDPFIQLQTKFEYSNWLFTLEANLESIIILFIHQSYFEYS